MISRRSLVGGTAAAGVAAHTAKGANLLPLRTHEWFGDKVETFEFPAGWQIQVQHMMGHQTPIIGAAEIRKAIENPVGTRRLAEIAAGKKTVAIAFDDLTRPTPTYEIVPHVIRELRLAGIRDENILFVAAYGCHYQMNGMEVAKKLGIETVRNHPWINHNIWMNVVDVGRTKAGNRIEVNTYYHKADVKITLSGLKAHGTPGYGGGPKLILPGICSYKTIHYMHNEIRRAPKPRTDREGREIFYVVDNEQRQDMIEAARMTGVDFSVQCVYNHERRPTMVVAGDVVKAHLRAARFAVTQLSTPFAGQADVIVVNAYPKGSQLHEHFGWGARGLKDGGTVLVINQNPMGEFVWHYQDEAYANHGKSWFEQRAMRRKFFPRAGQVLLYSEYLQKRELDNFAFPPEAQGCTRWSQVLEKLRKQHKGDATVAVYPYAGLQHGMATVDIPAEA